MRSFWLVAVTALCFSGCSSSSSSTPDKQAKAGTSPQVVPASSNPVAKYIELVGIRVTEKSPGKLHVQFGVVNHSEADIGDIVMDINLRATVAKPGEPPLVSFSTKIPALGPEDLKEVSIEVPTKLRAYELPDWQFLKSDFQITEPK